MVAFAHFQARSSALIICIYFTYKIDCSSLASTEPSNLYIINTSKHEKILAKILNSPSRITNLHQRQDDLSEE